MRKKENEDWGRGGSNQKQKEKREGGRIGRGKMETGREREMERG